MYESKCKNDKIKFKKFHFSTWYDIQIQVFFKKTLAGVLRLLAMIWNKSFYQIINVSILVSAFETYTLLYHSV
jgi:hypothetical protein